MSINVLPVEILLKIFKFLKPSDLNRMALTSKWFRDAVEVDSLWETKIREAYNLNPTDYKIPETFPVVTAKSFYRYVLAKYGNCLGFWRRKHFRGCLLIIYVRGGEMVGYKVNPPKRFHDGVDKTLCFKIKMKGVDAIEIEYYFNGNLCRGTDIDIRYSNGDEESLLIMTSDLKHTHNSKRGTCDKTEAFVPIGDWSSPSRMPARKVCSLKPGMYKGSYRSEGIEIVEVFVKSDSLLLGKKITGDQYVPAGEISFRSRLDAPLHPRVDQMQRMNSLRLVSICQNFDCRCPNPFPLQPFRVPLDCSVDVPGFPHPTEAKGWFSAEYRVAYPRFTNPEWVQAHMVIFSENEFAMFCFQLNDRVVFNSLAFYTKLKDFDKMPFDK